MPPERRPWTRDELLLALHLYWRIPFGQQHKSNPQVVELARVLGRTPSAVAMKLNNLTAVDPDERGRVKGLSKTSALDRAVFEEFRTQARAAAESEALWEVRVEARPARATETTAERTVRLGQAFFRRVVLANFAGRCAITGIAHPALLNASHIVGWKDDEAARLDPGNGIALNRLHDAAFDRKLVTFDEDHRLVIGRALRETMPREELSEAFLKYEGKRLRARERHELSPVLLERHRASFAVVNG